MSDSPYVQFYTSDFLAGTGGMTAATKGVYITLLCLIYEAEAPLPQSWATLARRCGCTLPAFKRAVAELIEDGKIATSDDGIWSEKCAKHIALRRERQRGATSAAKKRWQKDKQNQRKADAGASNPQCQPEPEPDITEETNVSSPTQKRGRRLPDDWHLPRDWGEWALSEGWPESVVRQEADKFKDHWIASTGRNASKRDWKAAWRNWMRNSRAPKVVNGDGYARTSKSADKLRAFISGAD